MDREMGLGRLMGRCSHLGRLCLEERLRGYDITPAQGQVLRFLTLQPQDRPITQRVLEGELRLRPSTINGVVERMEEKGLITRRISDADGRCRLVYLTERGRALSLEVRGALEATESLICSALSPEEQQLLRTLLQRVCTKLENEVHST